VWPLVVQPQVLVVVLGLAQQQAWQPAMLW
jgi:hypothetical protein